MKKLLAYILAVACVLGVTACGRAPEQEEDVDLWDTVAGKTFVYEKPGFGGEIPGVANEFYIYLWENGSFQYYEGVLSSHIGMGEWTLDGDVLTITEEWTEFTDDGGFEKRPHVNRFHVEDGGLTYLAEESANFLYVKVADGERFEGREGKPDILYSEV